MFLIYLYLTHQNAVLKSCSVPRVPFPASPSQTQSHIWPRASALHTRLVRPRSPSLDVAVRRDAQARARACGFSPDTWGRFSDKHPVAAPTSPQSCWRLSRGPCWPGGRGAPGGAVGLSQPLPGHRRGTAARCDSARRQPQPERRSGEAARECGGSA